MSSEGDEQRQEGARREREYREYLRHLVDEDPQEQERLQERLKEGRKLRFEYLKHITTLAGVTAAVELTIYQIENLKTKGLDTLVVWTSLGMLAGAVALGLMQMLLLTEWYEETVRFRETISGLFEQLATFLYVGGLLFFALNTIGGQDFYQTAITIASIAAVIFFLYTWLTR